MKLRLLKAVLLSFVILILGIINLGAIDNLPQECYAYFKGVVTDDQGQPLENAKVSIYNEKLGTYQSLTDKEGKYLLEVPSEWKAFPGTPYQILISKENYPALDDSQRFIQQKTYTKNYSLTSNTDYRFIKGKVYYKNTHLSLGQAKLTLKAKGSNKVISFTDSNSEGEFQLYLFDEKRGLFGSQKEYILSAEKEGYISFEKSISYEKDKIYNVYLEDITAPLEPKLRQTSFITNQSNYQLNGTKEEQTCLYVDDVKKTEIDAKTTWDVWLALEPGENIFNLYLEDIAGNKGPHKKITITRDDQAPALLKITPANHSVLDATSVNISGVVNDDTAVKSLVINDKEIKVSGEGIFSIGAINLNTGKNIFTIIIKDTAGNISNYGYELFSQIHVEGENIEDRKVNQPQVPAGEINSSDANPFMSTSKDLTSSRAIIIEEEPERAEGESSQAGALENNTPFFSAKKSPESNITYSSESNESKKDLVVFTSPYHNQIFSDDRLVIAGKYASEDVEEILVNGQTCVLDKENMTFIGPMLISPQEAKELGVAKNSKDYILVKVDQATHSGKNTLRCEVKLNGKKEEKEITYYYYQLFVKRDAYQHDTAIHKFEKDENEEQCFNFNLFNNPPYSLWEELEKNSRGRHPCSIRNNNWYYSLQETSPWFSLSDISYLNWYNGNKI